MENITYVVTATDAKSKQRPQKVYLKAKSPELAASGGRALHRAFGFRGRFRVSVAPYNPMLDRDFGRYIRKV